MRITTTKSKKDESFYITHSYIDKNGKSTSKIFKKLGLLSELSSSLSTDRDGVMVWAKQQAKIETEKYNNDQKIISIPLSPSQLIENNKQRTYNCGYLFLQQILSSLRIDNISRNIESRHNFDYSFHHIFNDLIFSRVLSPSSKRSSFDFAHTLLEKPKYDLHDVYRCLSVIAEESTYIQSELYKNSNFVKHRNTQILYYDCTNFFFEIEQEDDLKKYGKSKEHRPNPIVTMGLFMDADGIPLAFDIFPGNNNEQITLGPLEDKVIRDFDCAEFIYCSDAGLASKKNKLLNATGGRSYVITQSLKKLKAEDREIALNTSQYRKVGSNKFVDLKNLDETNEDVFNAIYYKEIPLISGSLTETLIVTYSPKYKKYQQTIREKQIQRAKKMINSGNKIKKTRKNQNDPVRFVKEHSVTVQGEKADKKFFELDTEAIENETMYDGFYAVSTNLDDRVEEIININKRRWEVEECFRIMKTDFKARPVYLQREDRIKAHFLVCFTSLLVYRLLEHKLNHAYTVTEILSTLREMKVLEIDGYGYLPTYTRTEITNDLHERFDFRTDYQIIKKAKMRSIIKLTKKH